MGANHKTPKAGKAGKKNGNLLELPNGKQQASDKALAGKPTISNRQPTTNNQQPPMTEIRYTEDEIKT
ncbi:MAG TPA: hypothetical protein PK228_19955, partial [Saprospiraceae bacterium]|nr:hypothetical protein [Saprospiraceae bacterium]